MSKLPNGTKVKLLNEIKSPPYQGVGIYIMPGTFGTIDNDDPEINGEIVLFTNGAYQTRLLLQRDDFEEDENR